MCVYFPQTTFEKKTTRLIGRDLMGFFFFISIPVLDVHGVKHGGASYTMEKKTTTSKSSIYEYFARTLGYLGPGREKTDL